MFSIEIVISLIFDGSNPAGLTESTYIVS